MKLGRERVAAMASADRQERLARALRENLKRRKARDRAGVAPRPETGREAPSEIQGNESAPLSENPAPKSD
jgi:hypothetical protein